MAGTLPPFFDPQFFDYRGTQPLIAAGYLLQTYIRSTTTPLATYSNEALSTPNSTPITLDGAGRCTMWLDPTKLYTFALQTPAGATLYTWDVTPTQIPAAGSYVPLDGSVPMTGLLTLSGPGTASLNPISLAQFNAGMAATVATVNALVSSATAAAAAAVAAAAAITPTCFMLADAAGGAQTQTVQLATGTWQLALLTQAEKDDGGGTYTITVTQSATVGTTTVNTSFGINRVGSSGYGRNSYGQQLSTGQLTVTTAGPYTLAMAAVNVGAATSKGSMLLLSKIA